VCAAKDARGTHGEKRVRLLNVRLEVGEAVAVPVLLTSLQRTNKEEHGDERTRLM
jgi:hypothetical protein